MVEMEIMMVEEEEEKECHDCLQPGNLFTVMHEIGFFHLRFVQCWC